ncbi:uncharacterized protein LOC143257221 isoform X2 [Tachypleus tridentatus]|uniref:uncharacterized protein LOC143257221 isoform X2 n=1 Tax=Tachypleus tridentatus TaxID=6853 RepID=UPI003FCF8922
MSYPISKNTSLVGKIKHLLTSTVSLGVEAKPVLRLVDRDDFQLNGKDMELYLGTPEQPLFSCKFKQSECVVFVKGVAKCFSFTQATFFETVEVKLPVRY